MLPAQLAQLTIEEKIALIESLWDAVDEEAVRTEHVLPLHQWQKDLLDEREKQGQTYMSLEELKKRFGKL
jgi:putative addiction module component (TIGR02574 family)